MRIEGNIDIDDAANAKARLDVNWQATSVEELCRVFALFVLRQLSNLEGRAEAAQIADDLRLSNEQLRVQVTRASAETVDRATRKRHFVFISDFASGPTFHLRAQGFGFLAKDVGTAARAATAELRLALLDNAMHSDLAPMLEAVGKSIAGKYDTREVKMTNQLEIATAVVAEASISSQESGEGEAQDFDGEQTEDAMLRILFWRTIDPTNADFLDQWVWQCGSLLETLTPARVARLSGLIQQADTRSEFTAEDLDDAMSLMIFAGGYIAASNNSDAIDAFVPSTDITAKTRWLVLVDSVRKNYPDDLLMAVVAACGSPNATAIVRHDVPWGVMSSLVVVALSYFQLLKTSLRVQGLNR